MGCVGFHGVARACRYKWAKEVNHSGVLVDEEILGRGVMQGRARVGGFGCTNIVHDAEFTWADRKYVAVTARVP